MIRVLRSAGISFVQKLHAIKIAPNQEQMDRTLETKLLQWSKPPSSSEQERCANAEGIVRSAVDQSERLAGRDVQVFVQGSYRNRTNFRTESDVDIGVVCSDSFFFELPEGRNEDDFGMEAATYQFHQFKNDVSDALTSYLGGDKVVRGSKAFDVRETSYHVEADVAPFFEHRRFAQDGSFITGVQMIADDGSVVVNWPEQHYQNGVAKNEATGHRYKAVVRALKGINSELPNGISTFLVECLVWNVPNSVFGSQSLAKDVTNSLISLHENLSLAASDQWGEVSELKYLFGPHQKWTKQQAQSFVLDAWNYGDF